MGGGYIAVECAGFLNAFGKRVHLMNRSIFLRKMDRGMSDYITNQLEEDGVRVYTYSTIESIE